ncbi:MAG: flagellar hook-basal body protein [candidate division Zixibacteria bacterium]|nr:flagellar hook-basal body protein [candidate division Zixibacteria bacterium]
MIKGLYTSASGMLPHLKREEITANNIANAGTPGFKKDRLFTKELTRAQIKIARPKSDWQKPMVNKVFTDFGPGVFDKTDNPLHLAIDGDGFFTLLLEDGGMALTRSGSFVVNSDGYLAVPGGALVMGEGGPIEVGGGKINVSASGEVEVNGSASARIVPVTVEDYDLLTKIGSSVFAVPDGVDLIPVTKSFIQQGYLEASNVDIVREMIDMIIAYRAYESNARAVQSQDQSLDNLFRRVAGQG